MTTHYNTIVVGAGIVGSGAALASQRSGHSTLLLEQFPVPHTRGSSTGHSRITRKCYPENAVLCELMEEAFTAWDDIARETDTKLFINCGLLTLEREGGDELRVSAEVMKRFNYPYDILEADELKQRYPQLHYPNTRAIFDKSAGILLADKCLASMQLLFTRAGGKLVDSCQVETIVPGRRVELSTSKGTFTADHFILCPGPWASPMLQKVGLHAPLKPESVLVPYWQSTVPSNGVVGHWHCSMPACNDAQTPENGHFYSVPAVEYAGLVKIVLPLECNGWAEADSRDENMTTALPKTCAYVAKHWPLLHPKPAIIERCMYTRTPDGQFIVDVHPKYRNIGFAVGMSGHGFKTAPVIGKIVGQMVRGEPVKYDMSSMRYNRFDRTAKL